jgi:microcystin-dependent protein
LAFSPAGINATEPLAFHFTSFKNIIMSEPYVGQIQSFAFAFHPRGWAFCSGQTISITQYTALFTLIGTTYGGDGQTTFGLPDLRGRAPIGQGNGTGLPAFALGQKVGAEVTTITTAQLAIHNHTFTGSGGTGGSVKASSQAGKQSAPSATVNTLGGLAEDSGGNTLLLYNNDQNPAVVLNSGGGSGSGTVGVTGSGFPVSILQPFLTINYSIALIGIFPTRD